MTQQISLQGNVCVVNGSPHLCSVLLYERSRKQWLRHAPMNTPRLHAAMAVVGGHLYIMVGPLLVPSQRSHTCHNLTSICRSPPPLFSMQAFQGAACLPCEPANEPAI